MQFTTSYMRLPMTFHTWICSELGSCAILSMRSQGSLKDPDCAPVFVYQIPWRAEYLSEYRCGMCAFEKERTSPSSPHVLQWTCFGSAWGQVTAWCMACDHGTSHLWKGDPLLPPQHNICFSKIFWVAGRELAVRWSTKSDISAGEWQDIWEI